MADRIDKQRRSRNMSLIRSKDTKPEIMVRKLLHRKGARFRLSNHSLPGSPDIVLPGRQLAIFVHGCFWHRHEGCRRTTTPASNKEFWLQKFSDNLRRDAEAIAKLQGMGWNVVVIWECETMKPRVLESTVDELLDRYPLTQAAGNIPAGR
ncbi:DNA mismatch endonuclease Vsr [Microvirga solisilvae]|uniref:very short patch repair endonuclease n=1 Tax=Microvirga solisilvae TaxID=2919498 RepID=UPI00311AB128